MLSIIKRILRLSGKYRFRVIAGLIFNALKSCCAAFVFFAVLLVMLNIEHLTSAVIWQAFGIIALSVLGRFLFQYLSDVLMSASGYKIFREKRLEIGNQLKRAPIGYFTENNLGTVQTVLTTTISDLEGNCMLALTVLVGGFVQALAMTLMLSVFCWQIGLLALAGILAGIFVLGQIKKRAGAHTEDMQNAQELLVGNALEYIKGISVLRIFGKGKEGKGKVDQAFENKCRSDIAVTISTAGIMKLYEAVFKITSCLLFLLSALLYLWGVIALPYCLLFIICAFLMFMELELMEDYLEAVLVLQKQKGYARCVDVSEFLGVTKPSVSRAVKELSKKKCLLKKDDGTLSLTEQGQSIAKQIYEKHRFFTKQLIKAGVPCDIAEADACRLEHVISETSFARLKEAATQEQK